MARLRKYWFLLALVSVLVTGVAIARLESTVGAASIVGRLADARNLRRVVVASVLLLMAWPLPTRDLLRTLRAPWPALLATAINIGLLPLLAYPLSRIGHPDLGLGLIIATSIPSTLASAAVWTRRAGGNDATAILVTLITNATCFLVIPMWLTLLTGRDVRAGLDVGPMIAELVLLVVAPMALGQLLRCSDVAAGWATRNKGHLATLAQMGILWIVTVGAIQCGRSLFGLNADSSGVTAPTALDLSLMFASVVGLHVGALKLGWMSAGWLGFSRPDRIAVGIAGSQKTLMIGLQIAVAHFGGFTILPMVSYHVLQLLIDAVVADRWLAGGLASTRSPSTAGTAAPMTSPSRAAPSEAPTRHGPSG